MTARDPGRAALLWTCAFLLLVATASGPAAAEAKAEAPATEGQPAWPVVRAIRFAGNRTTREQTMLRELVIAVGDPADPKRIERSRQAIQDLALFLSVEVEQQPLDDGIALLFRVRERWFVFPYPLVDINSDGDLTLGAQLRASNLFGLNHSARLTVARRTYDGRRRPDQLSVTGRYDAPLLRGSRWNGLLAAGHFERSVDGVDGASYGESVSYLEAQGLYSLNRHGLLSQGWSLGGGLQLQRQAVDDDDGSAPPSYGLATALIGTANYRDIRFNLYSETGLAVSSRVEVAAEGIASAYDYQRLNTTLLRSWPLGATPHQTLEVQGTLGAYFGGAEGRIRNAYNIGGAQALRGYGRDQAIGDFLYYGAIEYLRPVVWDALRLLVVAEAGSAWNSPSRRAGEPTYASIGIGLRLRVNVDVNLQFEIGVAMPVGDGGRGLRVFGGGNN